MRRVEHWTRREAPPSGQGLDRWQREPRGLGRLAWALCAAAEGMAVVCVAFSTRLREEIDLDTLTTELCAVADQTMEPRSVWLWLRPVTRSVRPATAGR
jgi:hypothetical protein